MRDARTSKTYLKTARPVFHITLTKIKHCCF